MQAFLGLTATALEGMRGWNGVLKLRRCFAGHLATTAGATWGGAMTLVRPYRAATGRA